MKRSWIRSAVVPLAMLVGAASFITTARACPMCKDSISDSDAAAQGALPSGFNTSVYYMLGGFFVTLGMITTTIVRGIRSTPTDVADQKGRGFEVGED